jgi:hypothetical protein
VVAAGLGEIASGGDAEFGGEALEEHGHEVAEEHDAEEGVTEFRTPADVGGPVAGIHVTHGDEIARSGKREDFAKPGGALANLNGAVGFRKRRKSQGVAPAGGGLGVQWRLSREFGECVAHRG